MNLGYVNPHDGKKYNEADHPYYDAGSQVDLETENGPISVLNGNAVKDTKYDPLFGIPRPSMDSKSTNFNTNDPMPYYDPIGDHKNIITSNDDSLIFSVPVNFQETLDPFQSHVNEINEQKRLIVRPGTYYDPTTT